MKFKIEREPNNGDAGLTMVEILIGLAILGVVTALAVPVYDAALTEARNTEAIGDLRAFEKEILSFKMRYGVLPQSLEQINPDGLLDPWGNEYRYLDFSTINGNSEMRKDKNLVPINTTYDLYSMGRDGLTKKQISNAVSLDDIIRANDGGFLGLAREY